MDHGSGMLDWADSLAATVVFLLRLGGAGAGIAATKNKRTYRFIRKRQKTRNEIK